VPAVSTKRARIGNGEKGEKPQQKNPQEEKPEEEKPQEEKPQEEKKDSGDFIRSDSSTLE